MKEIFNITERDTTHPVAEMTVFEPQPGRIDVLISQHSDGAAASITLDRAEALELARTIIQKLDMVIVQPLGADVMLVPMNTSTVVEWSEIAPGAVHKAPSERQDGRTTRQLREAPRDAIFVWCNGNVSYPRALSHYLGRYDLRIESLMWAENQCFMGCRVPIVIDHAARLPQSIRDAIGVINSVFGPAPVK